MWQLTALVSVLTLLATAAARPQQRHEAVMLRTSTVNPTQMQPQCWLKTNFPAESDWLPYEQLFDIASGSMRYGNDTAQEIRAINQSIISVAAENKMDPRFVLAIVKRESDGVTTIPCKDDGRSCGLMQVQGKNVPSCKAHPCPATKIRGMIECGVKGCGGASLDQCRDRYSKYGAIARCYNSGSVPDRHDWTVAEAGIRTYVQDVANILLGADWNLFTLFDDGRCGYLP